MEIKDGAILFESVELKSLASIFNASDMSHLAFLSDAYDEQALHDARIGLQKSVFLDENSQAATDKQPLLQAFFAPQRSLIVVADQAGKGRQEMIFLNHQATTLLYSRPDQTTHRLQTFAQARQVGEFIKSLFAVGGFPSGTRFDISAQTLENLTSQAGPAGNASAQQLLEGIHCPATEKELLLTAIQNMKASGSVAVLDLDENGQAFDGFSLAFLVDDQSAWLFLQSTSDESVLMAQRSGGLFLDLLDIFAQRLSGAITFDAPLDKEKIASFGLNANEFAFCLAHHKRLDLAQNLVQSHFPATGDIQANYDDHISQARDRLSARGWLRIGPDDDVTLAKKLDSAVSAVVGYDFVLQARIVRPNLTASATLHVASQYYTSVLRPEQDGYILEHGDVASLAAYLSKLFPDFGQAGASQKTVEAQISYADLSQAIQQKEKSAATADLKKAGLKTALVEVLAQDISEAIYQASIVRINANSQASQDEINRLAKPLLVLLRGPQRSWLYHLAPMNESGMLVLVKTRDEFSNRLSIFLS